MLKVVDRLKWQYNTYVNTRLSPGTLFLSGSIVFSLALGMVGNLTVAYKGNKLLVSEMVQISTPNPQTILLHFPPEEEKAASYSLFHAIHTYTEVIFQVQLVHYNNCQNHKNVCKQYINFSLHILVYSSYCEGNNG